MSDFNTVKSELLFLRFSDNEMENQLLSAHKVVIDIRYDGFDMTKHHKVRGQVQEKEILKYSKTKTV